MTLAMSDQLLKWILVQFNEGWEWDRHDLLVMIELPFKVCRHLDGCDLLIHIKVALQTRWQNGSEKLATYCCGPTPLKRCGEK